MKKFLLTLCLLFAVLSCGPSKHVAQNSNDNTYSYTQMYYTMNRTITLSQVDSMIIVDNLATLDKWFSNISGGKDRQIVQYFYIKSLDKNNELIYTLTQTQIDTIFRCTKRVTEEIK